MTDKMILGPDHELIPVDLMTWAKWFEKTDNTVALDLVGESRVSTVFIGVDYGFGGRQLWFETQVFGEHELVWRYATWDEAVAGHNRIVAALKEGKDPDGE